MLTQSLIWTNADGTVGIMKPAENARLLGETDAAFLGRVKATAPQGAVIIADSAIATNAAFVAAEAKAKAAVVAAAKAMAAAKLADMANDDNDPIWQAIKVVLRRLKAANIQ